MKKNELIKIRLSPFEKVTSQLRIGNTIVIALDQNVNGKNVPYHKITNGGAYADVFFKRNEVYVSWIYSERKGYGRYLITQIEKMAKGRIMKFPTVINGFLKGWLKFRGYKKKKEFFEEPFNDMGEILYKKINLKLLKDFKKVGAR